MKRPVSPFKLGLFVLFGLSVGLGLLIWIGAANVFQKTSTYASFFNFSVAGLQNGAAVQRLGVRVGTIADIGLTPDGRWVRVLIQLEKGFQVTGDMFLQPSKAGLTGQSYLALKSAGQPLPPPQLPLESRYPVLPNRQGEMDRMMEKIEEMAGELAQIDLSELVRRLEKTISGVEALVNDPALGQTLANLRRASDDLQGIMAGLAGPGGRDDWRRIYRDIAGSAETLRQTSQALARRLDEVPPEALADIVSGARGIVATGERAVGAWDRQVGQNLGMLENTIGEINRLVTEMDRLVRTLRQEPGQILERRQGADPFAR